MKSQVRCEMLKHSILVHTGSDPPASLRALCADRPRYSNGHGLGYMLPLSAAGELRDALQDRRYIDGHIAAPGPRPIWREPPGINLYSHQAAGVQFLIDRRSAMLADQMGTGKTMIAILASRYARIGGKVLVACPAGIIGNWLAELEKWSPASTAKIQTSKSMDFDCDYSIVSYDTAKRYGKLKRELLAREWAVLIMDESHRAKGMNTGRHQFLTQVRANHRWQLTGTPMLNRPADLLGLLRLGEHYLGTDEEAFDARFVRRDRDSQRAAKSLGLLLAGWIMRRYKDDILDLPSKLRLQHFAQTKAWVPVSMHELTRCRHQLAQEKVGTTVDLARSALEASDRNIIIYSCFRKPLDMLQEKLGRKYPIARIDGSVVGAKRQSIVDDFQAGKTRVLLGQIVAAGEGITLTRANTVIFNDLSYVPAEHAQAEDRAHRISQDSDVTVYYVLGRCHLDAALWGLLEVKRRNIGRFEDGLGRRDDSEVAPRELLSAIQARTV